MCCNNNILICHNILFKILSSRYYLIRSQHDLNKFQRKSALTSALYIYIYIHHVTAMIDLDISSLLFHSRLNSYLLYFLLLILFILSLLHLLKAIIVQDVLKSFFFNSSFSYLLYLLSLVSHNWKIEAHDN